MSVLIKGMKMPEDCLSCPLKEEGFCNITNAYAGRINERNSDCPLVEFPEHYGDLVDVKEIRWDDHYDSDGNLSKYKIAYSDEMPDPVIKGEDLSADAMKNLWAGCSINGSILPLLDARPTIVEAE